MAEQHSQTADYVNRWKFTGHELDKETGLYYAGARYYDPKVSIWLSVDPLADADKNIGYSPYAYAINNPITYIAQTVDVGRKLAIHTFLAMMLVLAQRPLELLVIVGL
jgi:RHS repeat-associated protein